MSALEEQRYRRFAAAVKETNVHLSAIFCRLSGQRGDAYCSHADDVKLAFAQGLDFHVRQEAYLTQPYKLAPLTAKPATKTPMMWRPCLCMGSSLSFHMFAENRMYQVSRQIVCSLRSHSCRCRPDNRSWRPFPALSGGQQALATLALSFALQAAYPSPLYFFDEIDCALDSSTAARVADYIRSQTRSQYIVVSHKPQVQLRLAVHS